ncbi:MAG: PD-(D/E)XK nuclease family protein [Nocardioides sp.]|nr:PD-(D/E)XK nuclease family protein [Nocardioides sp.]
MPTPPTPPAVAPGSPAERVSTPVDGVEVLGALSPSRAAEFLACPLAYRFRTIDRLPEATSPAMARGTLVHKVLEDLFDLPAERRTPEAARGLLLPSWELVLEQEPGLAEVVGAGAGAHDDGAHHDGTDTADAGADWLASCAAVLERYFTLEDPRRLEPAQREVYVEHLLESRLLLRGFVDRVDVAPDGAVRIVDYKTGRAPAVGFEQRALFQMRFYALVWWRLHGVLPTMLQLVYLGSGEIVRYEPDEQDLEATRRKVEAIWAAIQEATATADWRPRPSRLCSWCAHQAICPTYGGTPPPLPDPGPSGAGPVTRAPGSSPDR